MVIRPLRAASREAQWPPSVLVVSLKPPEPNVPTPSAFALCGVRVDGAVGLPAVQAAATSAAAQAAIRTLALMGSSRECGMAGRRVARLRSPWKVDTVNACPEENDRPERDERSG